MHSKTKVLIITNPLRDTNYEKTMQIIKLLIKYNMIPVLPKDCELKDVQNCLYASEDNMFLKSDIILTLGGDGTILCAVSDSVRANKPIVGINIGHIGYLTDNEFKNAEDSIKKISENKYKIESRMLLNAEIISNEDVLVSELVLNDICLTRGFASKIIRFDLEINNTFVSHYNADGIIVSTPTGSTAYNLSAGGPILNPNSKMIAITPICPHCLSARPIVGSLDDLIVIKNMSETKETIVSLDGREPYVLDKGGIVRIKRSELTFSLLKTNDLGFYEILGKKLLTNVNVEA